MCRSAPPINCRSPDQHLASLIPPSSLVKASKIASLMDKACTEVSFEHFLSSGDGNFSLGAVMIQSLYPWWKSWSIVIWCLSIPLMSTVFSKFSKSIHFSPLSTFVEMISLISVVCKRLEPCSSNGSKRWQEAENTFANSPFRTIDEGLQAPLRPRA